MANVTATDGFFVDPRYDAAALHLGLPAEVVRLRCLELYSWQTEHYTAAAPTHEVTPAIVIGKLKHLGAPAALVAAGLAEERPNGLLYIKGSRGRIEWLSGHRADRQEERSAGGRLRVTGASRDARGRLLPRSPAGQGAGQPSPAITSSPPASWTDSPAPHQLAGQNGPAQHPAPPADPGSGIWDQIREREGEGTSYPATPPPLQLQEPRAKTQRAKPRKPVETPIPADFVPGPASVTLAAELQLDLVGQLGRWRDKAAASGWTYVDHQAGFRTWLRKAAEFRDRDRGAPSPAAPASRQPQRGSLSEPAFKPL